MGMLRRLPSGEDILLTQRCILGRSRACTVRVHDANVSGEHASLRWVGGAWSLQDLQSRNGTFVDAQRLAPGDRAVLALGSMIGLGRPDSFVLVDTGPPEAFAAPLDGGPPVVTQGGILALPDPAAPQLMIFLAPGGWTVERAGEGVVVDDGEIVRIGDDAWQLNLPKPLAETEDSLSSPPAVDSLALRFHVSRDEEYVELVALHAALTIDLKARAHHYTLLMLARARLRDSALPVDRQGWVLQSDLLTMLRVDANHLHLDIYRLRRQFGEAGIANAAHIIERRAGTRALRIGVSRIEICALDGSDARGERPDRTEP
jgi:hypothetical protein